MGRLHLAGLGGIIGRRLLDVRLAAISGLHHARGRQLARQHGCRYEAAPEGIFDDPDIQAIIIATPTATHLDLVRRAIRADKAIFMEKPLGRNLAEARAIARLLRRHRRPHQVGLVLRFSPTYNVLKRLIAQPSNGEFRFCRFRDDQFFPVGSVYDSDWRADVGQAGGGTLLEHSIHDVDVLRWFFGDARVTDAMIEPSAFPGIERSAALNLRFKAGGEGQLASLWHDNRARPNERHIEIFFERRFFQTDGGYTSPIIVEDRRGTRRLEPEAIRARHRAMIGWRQAESADFPATVGYELYVFLKAVLAGRRGAVSAEEALAAHRIIESAYRMGKRR